MMEYVPLHTARDPCSEHTHVCRLDYALTVEDLITVGLVCRIEKTTSDVRKHTDLHIIILKVNSSVSRIHLFDCRVIIHCVWIYATFCPLVSKISFEKRCLFGSIHPVSREILYALPHLYRTVLG